MPVLRIAFLAAGFLFCCSFSAQAACSLELGPSGYIYERGLQDFVRCMNREMTALRRENARLRQRMDTLEAIAAEIPADYRNVDGKIEAVPGRAIGRASFTLNARLTGGAAALALDQHVLEALCGKSGGCLMTLGFRETGILGNTPGGAEVAGPCAFQYEVGTGAWVIGQGCGDIGKSGIDGDQRAALDAEGDVVASVAGACVLAESGTKRAIGDESGFERDHARGLFLISLPSKQVDGIRRYQCTLLLD